MCDIFETRNLNYDLRLPTDFTRTRVNTSSFGLNSLKYLATKIWDIVPYNIKSVENLNSSKKKIRNWELKGCHSRLCKQYVHGARCRICGHVLIYIYYLQIFFFFKV